MSKLRFSTERAERNFEKMNLSTKWLAVEMHLWAEAEGHVITFTETWTTPEEDKVLKRKSDTHRTGRAFDVRTKDLPPEFVSKFIDHFTTLYNSVMGAVTPSGPNLIEHKPHGSGPHMHVQIRRDYEQKKNKATISH